MAYSELIKDFGRIRDYMREFYVYGFKSREECGKRSARTYDNERRRIESYLGDYMGFRTTSAGKNVFLSVDSRAVPRDPLYRALKAKSFTDGDITLHFILFDILYEPETALTLGELLARIDGRYLARFPEPMAFDESTLRKKLREYEELGLIARGKRGQRTVYSRTERAELSSWGNALAFFSEAGLLGAVGSFLLDRLPEAGEPFCFKHHDITHALESEVLCRLLTAISARRAVTVYQEPRAAEKARSLSLTPLKIYVSVQNGRRYLMGYCEKRRETRSIRLDQIAEVTIEGPSARFDELRARFAEDAKHMWGVSGYRRRRTERVSFTVRIGADEGHVLRRLEREKRCGTVEREGEDTWRFSADVYDAGELLPWIRTFLCRITSLSISNRAVEDRFREDLAEMYRLYGLEGE